MNFHFPRATTSIGFDRIGFSLTLLPSPPGHSRTSPYQISFIDELWGVIEVFYATQNKGPAFLSEPSLFALDLQRFHCSFTTFPLCRLQFLHRVF